MNCMFPTHDCPRRPPPLPTSPMAPRRCAHLQHVIQSIVLKLLLSSSSPVHPPALPTQAHTHISSPPHHHPCTPHDPFSQKTLSVLHLMSGRSLDIFHSQPAKVISSDPQPDKRNTMSVGRAHHHPEQTVCHPMPGIQMPSSCSTAC